MKILQIGKFYSPVKGGIETVVKNLAQGIHAEGHEVAVLCANQSPTEIYEKIEHIPVIRLASYGQWFSQPLIPSLFRRLMDLSQQYDILHFHLPNPLAEFFALFLPPSCRIVATYHADVTRQKFLIPFYHPILQRFLKRAQKIIVATSSHIQYSPILSHWPEDRYLKRKISIIPFGIIDPPEPPLDRIKEIQTRHGPFALFVGRHVLYKGITYLIDAFASETLRNSPLKLVILGDGPLCASHLQYAQSKGLMHRIHFQLGVSQDQELLAYYQAAEMVVLPSISREEAFGIVLLEAMACAKPMISTRLLTGIQEMNQNRVTGLTVPPQDSAALASAIFELTSSENLRTTLGHAGRTRFQENFTAQVMTQAYIQLYQQLMKEPST